jgi:uncharacterized glyoxalase superfamily protein PhnB
LASFYEQVTGIKPVGCSEHYVEIELSAGVLAICSNDSVRIFNAAAAEPRANRTVIIEFEVADVDRERARLANVIESFVMEPTDQPWGNRSMLFRDPDGNLINIYAIVHPEAATSENCGLPPPR